MKYFTLFAIALFFSLQSSAQLINPGIESGVNVGWVESSTNFGTPLCDAACGTCGGPCVAQDGSWYVWYGGAGTNLEVGSISQSFVIPNGTAGSLSFYVKVALPGDGSADDLVAVVLDGVNVFTVNASETTYTDYTQITVDVSDKTDGQAHILGVIGVADGGSNILFDSFNLVVDGEPSVGFDQQLNGEKDFALYPNPANDVINLHFGQRLEGESTIRIVDFNGRLVSEQLVGEVNSKVLTLETALLPAGIYYVEVQNGSELIRERISVVH